MKRVIDPPQYSVQNLVLSLDEVERIIEILSVNSRVVEVELDEWKLESPDELSLLDATVGEGYERLHINSGKPIPLPEGAPPALSMCDDFIYMTGKGDAVFVQGHGTTPEVFGLVHQVKDLLEAAAARTRGQKVKFAVTKSKRGLEPHVPAAPAPVPTPVHVTVNSPPAPRPDTRGFWARNVEHFAKHAVTSVITIVTTAILAALIGYRVGQNNAAPAPAPSPTSRPSAVPTTAPTSQPYTTP